MVVRHDADVGVDAVVVPHVGVSGPYPVFQPTDELLATYQKEFRVTRTILPLHKQVRRQRQRRRGAASMWCPHQHLGLPQSDKGWGIDSA